MFFTVTEICCVAVESLNKKLYIYISTSQPVYIKRFDDSWKE